MQCGTNVKRGTKTGKVARNVERNTRSTWNDILIINSYEFLNTSIIKLTLIYIILWNGIKHKPQDIELNWCESAKKKTRKLLELMCHTWCNYHNLNFLNIG